MMSQRKCWTAFLADSASASSSSQENFANIVGTLGSCAQPIQTGQRRVHCTASVQSSHNQYGTQQRIHLADDVLCQSSHIEVFIAPLKCL